MPSKHVPESHSIENNLHTQQKAFTAQNNAQSNVASDRSKQYTIAICARTQGNVGWRSLAQSASLRGNWRWRRGGWRCVLVCWCTCMYYTCTYVVLAWEIFFIDVVGGMYRYTTNVPMFSTYKVQASWQYNSHFRKLATACKHVWSQSARICVQTVLAIFHIISSFMVFRYGFLLCS